MDLSGAEPQAGRSKVTPPQNGSLLAQVRSYGYGPTANVGPLLTYRFSVAQLSLSGRWRKGLSWLTLVPAGLARDPSDAYRISLSVSTWHMTVALNYCNRRTYGQFGTWHSMQYGTVTSKVSPCCTLFQICDLVAGDSPYRIHKARCPSSILVELYLLPSPLG